MKPFKWLALLAVPVVTTLGLSSGANAAPAKTDAPIPTVNTVCSNPTNEIFNISSIGLGVFPVGSTTQNYTNVLPAGGVTCQLGYTTAGGWYNGPGYCSEQWRWDNGGPGWVRQSPDLGQGQHRIGSTTSYQVKAYQDLSQRCGQ